MPAIAPGIRGQTQLDDLLDFSGVIAAGGAAQLVLPQQPRRLSLFISNLATADTITIGIGPPAPVATISGGGVTGISVSGNAGVGFTVIPQVVIAGGLITGDYQTAPSHPAVAHVTGLSGSGGISGITIDDPGAGYLVAPLVYLMNPLPHLGGGAKLPSATTGIALPPGWTFSTSGMLLVPTSAVAIYGATTSDTFEIKVGGLV